MSSLVLTLTFFAAAISGCGASRTTGVVSYAHMNASQRYAMATAVCDQDGDPALCRELHGQVVRDFPYSRYRPLAELRMADSLVKEGRRGEAVIAYELFLARYPEHPQAASARVALRRLRS